MAYQRPERPTSQRISPSNEESNEVRLPVRIGASVRSGPLQDRNNYPSPEKRLAQHNSQLEKYAGQIVKETGQKWELKTYIAVPDPYFAEKAFWRATWVVDMPGGAAIEVMRLDWKTVQAGLDAARAAGVRPPPAPPSTAVRNAEWMLKQLEGTGITFQRYRGLIQGTDFQCEKGHEFTESAGLVAHHKSCPLCGPDYRTPWRRAASSRP